MLVTFFITTGVSHTFLVLLIRRLCLWVQIASESLPRVAIVLQNNEAVVEGLGELMDGVDGECHLLAAEALVQIPGCSANARQVRGAQAKLSKTLEGEDWGASRRAAKCLLVLAPESIVDRLLGWLSGDEAQMPADMAVPTKDVRVEACLLLGQLNSSRNEAVQEALLLTMQQCTQDIDNVDVAVGALQALR